MIRFLSRIFHRDTPPVTDNQQERRMFPDRSTLIAKRGLRLHNRSAKDAAKYERVHLILAEGRSAEICRQG